MSGERIERREDQGTGSGWRAGAETVWLPTSTEMADLDAFAVSSGATTERALIETAGREIARRVQLRWPEGRVVALAGSGHNGADALVALRTLSVWGREVAAVRTGRTPPQPDVIRGWPITLQPPEEFDRATAHAAVLLDGILGTGLSGPPRKTQAAMIRRVNATPVPVCAIDGPSGANLTTGQVDGECVEADLTVALGWPKLGHLRYPAREYCGDIEAVEIGFPPPPVTFGARAITGRWVARLLIPRPPDAHKGRAGYLALIAGRKGMAGAVVLAARAALRGGVGIVKVVSDPANREIVQRAVPGAIFVGWDDAGAVRGAIEWAGAIAAGPGLGRRSERRELLEMVLSGRGTRSIVLDADGLSVWEGASGDLAAQLDARDVITPHPGELARLRAMRLEEILEHPAAAGRSAHEELGCVVVVKGMPSLIVSEEPTLRVSTVGGSALATGGTGDVLTGLIGAYLAAGMKGVDAATAAMFLSGVAAEQSIHPVGHTAEDVPDRLPDVRAQVERLPPAPDGPLIFASYVGAEPAGSAV